MEVKIYTDVTTEPLTTAEAKTWLKVDIADDDTLIAMMLKAVREACEEYTGLCLAQKTLHAYWDFRELKDLKDEVTLPYAPVSSISAVKTIDVEGTETTLTLNSSYYVYGMQQKKVIIKAYASTVVGLTLADNFLRVEYVAGYGASGCESIPSGLKLAMLKQLAEWYENRTDYTPELSSDVKQMLNRYKIVSYL